MTSRSADHTGLGRLMSLTAAAIVVAVFFNNEQHLTNPHDWDAYPDYVNGLRALTEAFDGQVALIHGDSHYFKIDKPINHSSGGGVLTNFTRVETFGARNTHWFSAAINAHDPNVFVFEPRIVAGNTQ